MLALAKGAGETLMVMAGLISLNADAVDALIEGEESLRTVSK